MNVRNPNLGYGSVSKYLEVVETFNRPTPPDTYFRKFNLSLKEMEPRIADNNLKCEICEKKFTTNIRKNRHMIAVHEGQNNYKWRTKQIEINI